MQASNVWRTPMPKLPKLMYDTAAAVVDGALYVLGGRDRNGEEFEDAYAFLFGVVITDGNVHVTPASAVLAAVCLAV